MELKKFQNDLKNESIYFYETGFTASFEKIAEITSTIDNFKHRLSQYQYYEDMFKFSERESNGCQKIIEVVETEVGWMKKLWEHIQKCE